MQLFALCKKTPEYAGVITKIPLQAGRVMKITAFILLTACLQVSAGGYSQTKVTLNVKQTPLIHVLNEIRKQTGYNFFYQTEWLEKARKVDIQVKDASLKDALDLCFKNQPLSYTLTDNSIVLQPKTEVRDTPAVIQNIEIRGVITDEDGKPLAGANVKVKGTNIGVTTINDGSFILKGIDENAILEISYIGFETQTVSVKDKTSIILPLKRSEGKLDEVQIIAYGQTTQRLQTGNVSTVKATDIQKQPVNNPLLALQGRVPGMVITQNTGVPGGGITIRIQGQNSLNRGNSPLYVIDGVPYASQLLPNLSGPFGILAYNGEPSNTSYSPVGGGNPLSFINPADIESIEVLKDADATSIYGSRAAQGAVLITTKKGKVGKTKLGLNIQHGWGKVTRMLDLLNTQQYLEMRHEAKANDGVAIFPTDYDINGTWDTTRYTDWQKNLIGKTAQYTDAQVSVSGGSVNTNFLVSAGYHRETTVFPGDLADRKGSLHFNINHVSVNGKFRFQLTGNYMVDNNQLISTDLTETAIKLAPNAPALYSPDGTLNWELLPNGNSTWYNPLVYLHNTYTIKTNNLISNALVSYQLLPGLDIKSSFGYTSLQTNEVQIYPLAAVAPQNRPFSSRFGLYANNNANLWISEPQVTYKGAIGRVKLEGLAGVTIQQSNNKGQQLYGLDYPSDEVIKDINSAATIGLYWPAVNSIYKYNAVFGRINLNWADKYIVNLTARRDGSSRFGPQNQFQNFGSVAGVWIFSNEVFMQKKLSFISFGKLRASYGSTGSDQIGDYQFMNLYNAYSVAAAYQGAASLVPAGLPNPYLEWEETKKLQFGLDLGFFKDRIFLTTNYYHNRSSNQLQPYDLPLITGVGSIQANFPAVIENTGWEFSLNTRNVATKEFMWNSSFNLTIPRNKLVAFPDLEKSSYAEAYVIGKPITIFKAFAFSGVDPATGVYQFTDKNGNITSTPDFSTDRIIEVNVDPKFYGGFQNSFTYQKLQLDVLFQFVKQTGPNYFFGSLPGRFRSSDVVVANQPVFVMDRWQKPGDNKSHQMFSSRYLSPVATPYFNATSSSAAFSDASYIRLKNLSLSWHLPEKWKQAAHLQNARLYVQGQNLLTITNYKGIDPENTNTRNLPPLRVLTLGIQIEL